MAADTPTSVRIRAYDVGFGDCFLVTFAYPSTERHVLIDFGSFPPPKRKSAGNMPAIAEHIRATCKGALTAVVATHRHADHITGFTTKKGKGPGDVIRDCKPKVVVQPWTEDPKLAADAPGPKGLLPADRSHVSALADMVRFREALLPRIADLPSGWKGVRKELEFLVGNGVSNAPAVENLGSMAPKGGQRYVYYGAESGLGAVLPGVKVRVLGPPTISQSAAVEAERSSDAAEFWQILAASAEYWQILAATAESRAGADGPPFAARYRRKGGIPGFASWLVSHADAVARQQVLSIVRRMDDYMNNTSVILLFEVGGKKFLFPGDAQIENWSYALSQPGIPALLSGVDVYKVGHHGSRNATPKAGLWAHFAKRNKASGRLVTFLSTEPGRHGTAKNHTEVPRTTLAKALENETELYSTNAPKTLTKERGVAFIEHTVRV